MRGSLRMSADAITYRRNPIELLGESADCAESSRNFLYFVCRHPKPSSCPCCQFNRPEEVMQACMFRCLRLAFEIKMGAFFVAYFYCHRLIPLCALFVSARIGRY